MLPVKVFLILFFCIQLTLGRVFRKVKISEERWNSYQTSTISAHHMVECSLHCKDDCTLYRFTDSTCFLANMFVSLTPDEDAEVEVFARDGVCPQNWIYFEQKKLCFGVIDNVVTFDKAVEYCKEVTGNAVKDINIMYHYRQLCCTCL